MTYLIVLAALALVPVLAILLLRVNGAIAFMSLCLGSVLMTYVSDDVQDIVTSFAKKGTIDVQSWVHLGLLVLPFLLTILFTRGSVHGGKKLTNLLPAIATGLLFALLVVAQLPDNLQGQIENVAIWHQLDSLQTAVILGGAAFSLVFLLFTHRGHHEEGKKHAGKHH